MESYNFFNKLVEKKENIVLYGKVDFESLLKVKNIINKKLYLLNPEEQDLNLIELLIDDKDKITILSVKDYLINVKSKEKDIFILGDIQMSEYFLNSLLNQIDTNSLILTSFINIHTNFGEYMLKNIYNIIKLGNFKDFLLNTKNRWLYLQLISNNQSNNIDKMEFLFRIYSSIINQVETKRLSEINENKNNRAKYLSEKIERIKLQNEIIEVLKREKKTITKYQQLKQKYQNLENKYQNLSKSRLGRITLKYWKLRKGR